MKTNKSVTKRLRITRRKKVIARRGGQNHFNAKESRSTQLSQKRTRSIILPKKISQRYLP